MKAREALAGLCHEQWSGWMRYLFGKCTAPIHHTEGGLIIPDEFVKRWNRQVLTPYAMLSEEEKESDRKEADKIIRVLSELEDIPEWIKEALSKDFEEKLEESDED